VIDDDLAAVVVHVPIMVALFDDDRIVIAMIAVANHVAVASYIDIAVAMALTDGHADRTHTHANFFRKRRQRSPDHRGSRYHSYVQFHFRFSSFSIDTATTKRIGKCSEGKSL
jgi:hypothetical protein